MPARGAGASRLVVAELELLHAQVSPKTTWSFVRLTCGDGSTGIGEASLMREWGSLDAPFRAAADDLRGNPLGVLLSAVDNAARETLAVAAVASALEQAAWDVSARSAGVPVWSMLGGVSRAIPLYANINRRTTDRSPEGFRASAAEAVAAGFRAFKLAPFDDLLPTNAATPQGRSHIERGLARVSAVRDAILPTHELLVDCHWRFTPDAAIDAIDALAEFGVVWFECPLPERQQSIAAIAATRRRANARGMRLAGLEELTSPQAFRPWLKAGAYDVVMPDVKYCGGIADLIAIGAEASRFGANCSPHNPSGPVGHAASLAACAKLAAPVLLEHQWDETPWFFAIGGEHLPRPADGVSALPSAPGLGVALHLDGLTVARLW